MAILEPEWVTYPSSPNSMMPRRCLQGVHPECKLVTKTLPSHLGVDSEEYPEQGPGRQHAKVTLTISAIIAHTAYKP